MFAQKLFLYSQYLPFKKQASKLAGKLAKSRNPKIKNWLIKKFLQKYAVNMAETEKSDPTLYVSFNEFFIRTLKKDARPITKGKNKITSPCDGAISQFGDIKESRIVQAKQHNYNVLELLAGDEEHAADFMQGKFMTIYLAPRDYHRVHMPCDGRLVKMLYVPGDLFSVNKYMADNVENLFARNERVICIFETKHGKVAVVMVGACMVGSIATTWAGTVTPNNIKRINTWTYPDNGNFNFKKGDEIGYFQFGSTVIMLHSNTDLTFEKNLTIDNQVNLGETILNTTTGK